MSKRSTPTKAPTEKSGPLYTHLETYDATKHGLALGIGGILGHLSSPEAAAKKFCFQQQIEKFPAAFSAMGITAPVGAHNPDAPDARDIALVGFFEKRWPVGFSEPRPKVKKVRNLETDKNVVAFRTGHAVLLKARNTVQSLTELLLDAKSERTRELTVAKLNEARAALKGLDEIKALAAAVRVAKPELKGDIRRAIYRGAELCWPEKEDAIEHLRTYGPAISKLDYSNIFHPLDDLAKLRENLCIVTSSIGGPDASPIGWAVYRRLRACNARVELGTMLAPRVLAEFEAMVSETDKDVDAQGVRNNPAGLVIVDASFGNGSYAVQIQTALAEIGLRAEIVKKSQYFFPEVQDIKLPMLDGSKAGNPGLPASFSCYLINTRPYVPPRLLKQTDKSAPGPVWQSRYVAEPLKSLTPMLLGTPESGAGGILSAAYSISEKAE